MTVVHDAVMKPDGTPWSDLLVEVWLVVPGWDPVVDESILGRTSVLTDAQGAWSMDLVPNGDLVPADTFYVVKAREDAYEIQVPPVGPVWVRDVLVSSAVPPPDVVMGPSGKQVELQASATHVQWRWVGDAVWIDLVPLVDLSGTDGREVQLDVDATHVLWRYVGDPGWIPLVALDDLKGEPGDDAAELELQVSATHVQWRRVGELGWTDLILLADISGEDGDPGPVQTISHGADANVARPHALAIPVGWVGSVQPNNWMAGVDYWIDTA
jgi:hypothetical protein